MTRDIKVQSTGSGRGAAVLRGTGESSAAEKDYVKVYTDELKQLQTKITQQIPEIEENQEDLFCNTCLNVTYAQATRDAADKARNNIPNDEKERKDDANKVFDAAQKALDTALQINVDAAKPILGTLNIDKIDLNDLCKCCILLHATPAKLGAFANRGPEQAALVENLLKDPTLCHDVVLAGGAKDGKYGEAMEIYSNIQKHSAELGNHEILLRCALGTALEHATPMAEFDTPDIMVDPVLRYLHYEQAYMTGELDVTFCDRTVWECRMITNCDAPNAQLGWGRSMLRHYRPDEMFLTDYIWRYCRAVRTEVGYRHPEWTSRPRTYQQLISGGGECGPRAWFARFCCKMFGIPTWGARQPGHAMCHHWTPTGWVGVLGADWKFSSWEGRCGPDFRLETQARGKGEDVYFTQVRRLQMIADALGEKPLDGRTGLADGGSLWRSLALMATKVLATQENNPMPPPSPTVRNLLLERSSMKDPPVETMQVMDDGKIILPATSCSKPTASTKNIVFMPSFLGGMQLNCREADSLEYTLSGVTAGSYHLTLRLCTVHLKQQPLLVTVEGEDYAVSVATITVPYTIGEWQYTDPVDVDLTDGVNILSFARETPNFGVTIKEIILTPA